MQKKNPAPVSKKLRINSQQRSQRISQYVFVAIAIIVILSMVIAAFAKF